MSQSTGTTSATAAENLHRVRAPDRMGQTAGVASARVFNSARAANPRSIAMYLAMLGVAYLGFFAFSTAHAATPLDSSSRPFSAAKYRDYVRQMEAVRASAGCAAFARICTSVALRVQASPTRDMQMRDESYQNPHALNRQPGARLGTQPEQLQ